MPDSLPKRKAPPSSSGSSSSGSSGSSSSGSGSSSSGSGSSSSGSSSGSSSSGSGSSSSGSSGSSSSSGSGSSSSSSSSSSDSESSSNRRSKKSSSSTTKKKNKRLESARSQAERTGAISYNDPSKYAVKTTVAPLLPASGASKWWSRPPLQDNTLWTTLDHNGILFAPPYVAHGIKMKYDGAPVDLTPAQEEVATFFAQVLGTDHADKPVFCKNFFADWKELLGKDHVIQKFELCDFRPIRDYLDQEKERKAIERKTVAFKTAAKAEKERLDAIYGTAIVDGSPEQVGNYKVEIPTLFRGRGGHPKTGKIKRRIVPEDVILNIGPNMPIPKCPLEGHQWKGVIHNQTVTWLAFYRDELTNSFKYVYLAASSRFKGESDRNKYNKARRLHKKIDDIRRSYSRDLYSSVKPIRQRATAMYLIDKLALRVGNEKDTAEAADTVGCCSLRVEHIKFEDGHIIDLDFLGKDSIAYKNRVKIDERPFVNLKEFCQGKRPGDDIFDQLNPSKLNDHLKELMPGLSAKVFRTYNASITLENLIRRPTAPLNKDATVIEKVAFYQDANRAVAILCNHQKSQSKGHDQAMTNLQGKLDELKQQHETLLDKRADSWNGKKLPDMAKRKEQAVRLKTRIDAMETRIRMKDSTKTVALGTSKINYMDPRITVAWCKEQEVPIEKVFNRSLLTKFPWAFEAPSTWRFEDIDKSEF